MWKNAQWMQDLVLAATAPVLVYFVFRNLLNRLEPEGGGYKAEAEESRKKALAANRHLDGILDQKEAQKGGLDDDYDYDSFDEAQRRSARRKDLKLTPYEQTIALQVVAPDDIPVTFEDIGGLEGIIEELKESVIYPLTLPHLYSHSSSLLSAPSGVLLHGPPGCGKTMLAKALAHESGACFINLHISTLTEKWYGDSNKLVNAVFSLARKLQPSIIFIDEIDAVLGQRSSGEHEASGMVKAEFMTHWDGLASTSSTGEPQRICVLGATNRMQDIDEAILRRMPKRFPVSLPSAHQRRGIFKLILRDTKIDNGTDDDGVDAPGNDENNNRNNNNNINNNSSSSSKRNKKTDKCRPRFDLDKLVRLSAGLSGSEIKEACRDAAMVPVRECIKKKRAAGKLMHGVSADEVRGLRTTDFFAGVGAGTAASTLVTTAPTSLSKSSKPLAIESGDDAPVSSKESARRLRLRLRQERHRSRKQKEIQNQTQDRSKQHSRKRIKEEEVEDDDNNNNNSASFSSSSDEYETEEDGNENENENGNVNNNGDDDDDDKDSIEEEFGVPAE